MRFEIIIEADGNDAMRSRTDVAFALDAVARHLRYNNTDTDGPVKDLTGTRVGVWSIEDDEDTEVGLRTVHAQVESLFHRASGDSICATCSKPYRLHPFTTDRDYNGNPFLHQLCDGSVVKL